MKKQHTYGVTWHLGTKFTDAKGRKFEVTKVIMGYPEHNGGFEIVYHNGWVIAEQTGNHPQSRAGFVDIENPEKLIIESVEKLDQFVKNGHLQKL